MLGNFQKEYFEKLFTFQINLLQKILIFKKIVKIKHLDFNKCFHHQNMYKN